MNGTVPVGLAEAVQANCHIADARHATDMTLCTYLLQMREFHRWERGLAFGAALPRDAVGAWIAEREALWADVEDQDYRPLPLRLPGRPGDDRVEPFDVAAINEGLRPLGLLYGAGLVGADRPVFFLAELHGRTRRDGVEVAVAGRELARGLLAPPAALGHGANERVIVLRRESLARWCWEKFEAYALRRPSGSAFHAAVQAYGLDRDFEAALPRWLDEQSEVLVLHELGEVHAGRWLDPAWATMRLALPTRRADLYARAVRDHLADFGVTLPTLLDRGADASIHVWFANYDGVRELLFPSLAGDYTQWRAGDGGAALRRAIASGHAHFTRLARQVLEHHARDGAADVERLLTSAAAVHSG
ncbi:MAG: hypothetical protein Q7S90_04610 [Rubrivivax sp.]|nr:hypothetical protein [Rubrivivax sp.]